DLYQRAVLVGAELEFQNLVLQPFVGVAFDTHQAALSVSVASMIVWPFMSPLRIGRESAGIEKIAPCLLMWPQSRPPSAIIVPPASSSRRQKYRSSPSSEWF